MADERNLPDDVSIRSQSSAQASSTGATDDAVEVPVPVAMSPAEIDERAQVIEALRGDQSAAADAAERSDEAAPPA